MSGAQQAVFMNQRSFGPAIGSAYEGGFFAGQISTAGNGVADYNLVIAPVSSGESSLAWKSNQNGTTGSRSVIDGPGNTAFMVADGNSTVYPAAHFCNDAVIGGFSDWYMPALNELEVCYYNLKPTTTSNDTSSGTNTNAVPSRGSNYTAGTPAQTSAIDFQTGNTEAFNSGAFVVYNQSTEFADFSTLAITLGFDTGVAGGGLKTAARPVRCVRRVAV